MILIILYVWKKSIKLNECIQIKLIKVVFDGVK